MSDLPQLLEGNRRFTAHFADGELPIRPRLSTVVLTCSMTSLTPAGNIRPPLAKSANMGGVK